MGASAAPTAGARFGAVSVTNAGDQDAFNVVLTVDVGEVDEKEGDVRRGPGLVRRPGGRPGRAGLLVFARRRQVALEPAAAEAATAEAAPTDPAADPADTQVIKLSTDPGPADTAGSDDKTDG